MSDGERQQLTSWSWKTSSPHSRRKLRLALQGPPHPSRTSDPRKVGKTCTRYTVHRTIGLKPSGIVTPPTNAPPLPGRCMLPTRQSRRHLGQVLRVTPLNRSQLPSTARQLSAQWSTEVARATSNSRPPLAQYVPAHHTGTSSGASPTPSSLDDGATQQLSSRVDVGLEFRGVFTCSVFQPVVSVQLIGAGTI